jgi:hypothetical protein
MERDDWLVKEPMVRENGKEGMIMIAMKGDDS